jgi:large subunit ribosomal protein L29
MKAKDMREKSLEDLRELEKSLVADAFKARFKNFTNRLDDTSQLKKLRRDLSRVKTLLGEHARGQRHAQGAAKPAEKSAAPPKARAKAAPAAKEAKATTKKRTAKAQSEASK